MRAVPRPTYALSLSAGRQHRSEDAEQRTPLDELTGKVAWRTAGFFTPATSTRQRGSGPGAGESALLSNSHNRPVRLQPARRLLVGADASRLPLAGPAYR